MFHAPRPNENLAIGRLEYVEVICFKILLRNVLSKYRVGEVREMLTIKSQTSCSGTR